MEESFVGGLKQLFAHWDAWAGLVLIGLGTLAGYEIETWLGFEKYAFLGTGLGTFLGAFMGWRFCMLPILRRVAKRDQPTN